MKSVVSVDGKGTVFPVKLKLWKIAWRSNEFKWDKSPE